MSLHLDGVFDPRWIYEAKRRIRGHVLRTPLIHSKGLSSHTGYEVYLKMECWQLCGCFKVRGAINHVASLTPEERAQGIVTASSGNHALAVAYASSIHGSPPTRIYLPENADPTKVKQIEAWNPEIVFHGTCFQEAHDEARRYTEEHGAVFVHSHADPKVIAGQGTIGLEIMEDLPDVDAVISPIGGGGLISGISTAMKTISPGVEVYGVEPTAAPGAYRSLREGVCYETLEIGESIADGLLGGFGRLPFEICSRTLDDTCLVEDDEIVEAMRMFQKTEQVMV